METESPASPSLTRREMVILHIVAPAPFGGLEQVVAMLARGFVDRGHSVHVAALVKPGESDHPFFGRLGETGAEIHQVAVGTRSYLRERAAIASLCERIRPDVVHTHGYRPDVVDGPVAQRSGVPVITTLHGFTGGTWKNRLYERVQRRTVRTFNRVVVVSRALGQAIVAAGVPADRVTVIPNGWDRRALLQPRAAARSVLGIADARYRIGWVGRFSAEKAPDLFLDAIAELVDEPVAVSIIGEGPERPALEVRARALGLERHVTWHGRVTNAGSLFPAFDLYVLSSRTEGTPITLFEAMAAGVPVVATSVGGVPDVVSAAEAMLVSPGNAAALADAVRGALARPDEARARAIAARARLPEFRLEAWVERYEGVYERVAGRLATAAVTS